jgi:hypothetical protein
MASRDRVWVIYTRIRPDLLCKPYTPPLTYKRRGREGLYPSNHNTPTHTGHRIFLCKEAWTCLNPCVPCVSLFFTSVSTHTPKSTTVGAHHGAHEIKLRESNNVSINNQVSSWLQVVSRFSWVFDWQNWKPKPIETRARQSHRIRHWLLPTVPSLSHSRKWGTTQTRTWLIGGGRYGSH